MLLKDKKRKKGGDTMGSTTVKVKLPEKVSMAKAVREYCLQCGGGQPVEVRDCRVTDCPLFAYRFGRNPKASITYLKQYYNVEIIQ